MDLKYIRMRVYWICKLEAVFDRDKRHPLISLEDIVLLFMVTKKVGICLRGILHSGRAHVRLQVFFYMVFRSYPLTIIVLFNDDL
ncbi:hypothetical protein HanXRQr2_Chr06g0273901 [Helianthus annuus]|uniref:Uncharacterized protein n=1 Tax=Helianthus annuus TaxID=4232 RepID=A0A9K3IV17_HELAN|nr:hypothetical protein HanXRQr2_Chr06g0273901 [Helianthus annuus]KAJ0916679.1 hypothetical protein HanPSC8_Chr06g0264571 [Helianthus annuus]